MKNDRKQPTTAHRKMNTVDFTEKGVERDGEVHEVEIKTESAGVQQLVLVGTGEVLLTIKKLT